MRVDTSQQTASGWSLCWARCECGRPLCESGYLLAQPEDGTRWLVLAVATDVDWMDDQIATAQLSLDGDPQFDEAARTLAELYGWPWHALDEELALVSYAQMMNVSDELSEELRHWGHVGVRGLRRLTGQSPSACEAALLTVRRYRLDDGGGRITAGPLARP